MARLLHALGSRLRRTSLQPLHRNHVLRQRSERCHPCARSEPLAIFKLHKQTNKSGEPWRSFGALTLYRRQRQQVG